MGRLLNKGSAGKDRILLEKSIIIAIRELAQQARPDRNSYDLAAYIALSLKAISTNVENSVTAWEKRGYWLKADRYRLEWDWTASIGDELLQALRKGDWGNVSRITVQVSQKMKHVKVPLRNRIGKPWVGSWAKLVSPDQGH